MLLLKQLVLFIFNNETLNKSVDYNFNGMDFDTLTATYKDRMLQFNKENRDKLAVIDNSKINNKYEVVAINSSEEAEDYGEYTSWCITHGSFKSYAKDGARFYFCLADGFEDIEKEPTEGCPLDEYGLSMVSILIDDSGEPNIITTRWNHEYDGENNKNLCTAEQVQNVLGIPFYDTFKPYTKEELESMGIVPFSEVLPKVKEQLANGMTPGDSSLGFCGPFSNGHAIIALRDKLNFIDKSGNILSDVWFDETDFFNDYACKVSKNDRVNYFTVDGKLLSDEWFDDGYGFDGGYAAVSRDGKWNVIDINGNFILDSDKEVTDVLYCQNGYTLCVADTGGGPKWNITDPDGNFLLGEGFDYFRILSKFSTLPEEGYAVIEYKNNNENEYKWNCIDKKGNLIFDESVIHNFKPAFSHTDIGEGFICIVKKEKYEDTSKPLRERATL